MLKKTWGLLTEYSVLLIVGSFFGLIWANIDEHSYHGFTHALLSVNDLFGHLHDGHRELTGIFLVNDFLMAFFFALMGKEVWEAIRLKEGKLNTWKTAGAPVIGTLGGMLGPAGIFLLVVFLTGKFAALSKGWAIPMATDIAFSILLARIIFGKGHPAIVYLLLLAIVDDAGGLIILAIVYPQAPFEGVWLLAALSTTILAYLLLNRTLKINSWSPYLFTGLLTWWCLMKSGLHPALGLIPMITTMPHADTDWGIFDEKESSRGDTLNKFEHSFKPIVEIILFLFGLFNAGVVLSSVNTATFAVLVGLIVGKPLGIFLFGSLAVRFLKMQLPEGMNSKDLLMVGVIASLGLTVALFMSTVAFPSGEHQDAAKMGAFLSFVTFPIAIIIAKYLRVGRYQ